MSGVCCAGGDTRHTLPAGATPGRQGFTSASKGSLARWGLRPARLRSGGPDGRPSCQVLRPVLRCRAATAADRRPRCIPAGGAVHRSCPARLLLRSRVALGLSLPIAVAPAGRLSTAATILPQNGARATGAADTALRRCMHEFAACRARARTERLQQSRTFLYCESQNLAVASCRPRSCCVVGPIIAGATKAWGIASAGVQRGRPPRPGPPVQGSSPTSWA